MASLVDAIFLPHIRSKKASENKSKINKDTTIFHK